MRADVVSKVIFEYATKIGSARETDASLRLNADMARDLVGADRCSIWLIDAKAQQLWTKVAHGVEEIRIPIGQGVVGACIAGKETIVVNDTSLDPRFLSSGDYAVKSLLAIPLRGEDGSVIGALQALNKQGGFTQEDVDLLGLAAAYSASALETQMLREEAEAARLMRKELEIAHSVQQRLFPQDPPRLRGLDYSAHCRPARSVGGDYYDFIALDDGGLFFTLGDVSGKGIAAAVLMASIQASIRTQVLGGVESLANLMGTFNRAVYLFSMEDRYSTLFCGLLDGSMRKLTYVNAGQVRPLLLRSGGKMETLDRGGLPVGLLEEASYEQGEVILETGDFIVAFSDGISEATNGKDEMWDEAEARRVVRLNAGLTAEGMVRKLIAEADAFAGDAEQADDLTVVALKAV
ncbi:MAG: SpoIIE family protein phosphatase [Bryobacterales bacterium]|nr:SpoIIE family protein phosphatase [Bryobacterales bacterium]